MKQQIADDTFTSFFHSFDLYDPQIERFFLDNYIAKKTFPKNIPIDEVRPNTVAYIYHGLLKLYLITPHGEEMFNGFIPPYSIMISTPGLSSLGKYTLPNIDTEIYYASLSDYLAFIATSPSLILHNWYEPYYRRNLNDLPRYETLNQSARIKVYTYIRYITIRFGSPLNDQSTAFILYYPPTNKDIAHFNEINVNNVSTFLSELKAQNIIDKTKNKLIIHDLPRLNQEITRITG